jgi:hypothetical protein
MKVVIFGSRTIEDIEHVRQAVSESGIKPKITEIVSGLAAGADTLALEYARENGFAVKEFPAHWKELGRKAGSLRNIEMSKYADFGVAVWDGRSRGTAHMISLMEGRCHVFVVPPPAEGNK